MSLFSSTAEGVAMIRLVLSDQGILDEGMTSMFYPYKAAFFARFMGCLLRRLSPKIAPGGFSHLATRTFFYDAHIKRLIIEEKSVTQLVINGAGFDVRAWRMSLPPGTKVFELDMAEHPGVQNHKRDTLARHQVDTSHVTFLPIDYSKERAADVLTAGGLDPSKPTLFLMEGVTMYLPKQTTAQTVQDFRSVSAPGSYLMCELFDSYLLTEEGRADALLKPYWKTVSGCGEPYQGPQLSPEEMGPFWAENECEVVERYTPEQQLKTWKETPGAMAIDPTDTLPHGGICHQFLLKIK